jgi:lipoate-protein ligase A
MDAWRYIEENSVSASYGLAADEYLMRGYESDGRTELPALRLYTYRSHCALVGQFQEVEAEIDVNYCREANIPINRRPTGGGAIIMGNDQLGMALATSAKYPGVPDHPREIFHLYAAAINKGLKTLGIEGLLEGKNDLRVGGRKIAGLGLCRGDKGALLFHASLLVDLDIPLMLRVLKIPVEKLKDKIRKQVEENLTTVRREVGKPISVSEVRDTVRRGFESAMGVTFLRRPFTPREEEGIHALEKEKYLDQQWIFQRMTAAATGGSSLQKTKGGLLRIYLSLEGNLINHINITGDFFADRAALAKLEKKLRGIRGEEGEVKKAISRCFGDTVNPLQQIEERDLARGIMAAVKDARRAGSPYGCFVDPEIRA